MDGETREIVIDFIFLGSKKICRIYADGDCSYEIKRCLLLGDGDGQGGLVCCDSWGSKESDTTERLNWTELLLGRKAMANLDSILKNRDITLPTKVCLVKAMVFPVVMYGCESWTINKAERWRIDDFELWCWRRLLKVPWTARRSNQSILKEISPGCSLEGLMLKLKFQYSGHLLQRADSFEKTLMLGKIEGRRRRGRQRMRWLDGITDSMDWVWVNSGSWWWTGRPGVLYFVVSQWVGHNWVTELKRLI